MKRLPTLPDAEGLRRRLADRPWRLLESGPGNGAWNMAADVALLGAAAREDAPPTLRFYSWAPAAVSLGRNQLLIGVNLEAARRRGWDTVRRPTGGAGVLHASELTYSVVLPPSTLGRAGVRTSYAVLTAAVERGLRSLLGDAWAPAPQRPAFNAAPAPPSCFALVSACDTALACGKLAGSAQLRRGGALLQHG